MNNLQFSTIICLSVSADIKLPLWGYTFKSNSCPENSKPKMHSDKVYQL